MTSNVMIEWTVRCEYVPVVRVVLIEIRLFPHHVLLSLFDVCCEDIRMVNHVIHREMKERDG